MQMKRAHVFACAIILTMALSFPSLVKAGAKISIDDTKWVSIGAGLRTSFRATEDAASGGSDYSKDFEVDNIRLYLNGQVYKGIKFEFNTERDDDSIRVLDAIGKLEFFDLLNIWGGRLLPPSDRSNLDGPFYLNAWDFPFVQAYPAVFAGRDDGVAVWGQIGGGRYKYQIGAFQGRDDASALGGDPNQDDNLLYAGRLTFNFWDPEPGYYNSSIYYGDKDVLALGLVAQYQSDGAGTAKRPGNFKGFNVDFLLEKNLGTYGVVNLEAAYYNYDLDDVPDATLIQGDSYFVLASYLFPNKIGWGRFEPLVRYQHFDRDDGNIEGQRGDRERYEVGVNYIIDGHNARLSTFWAHEDPGPTMKSRNIFLIGLQLQI
jgi:hypothetical protein